MKTYKRNQVEDALSRLFDAQSGRPRTELLGRVKRLLDTDRRTGGDKRSATFAFSDGPPGTSGIEVQFTDYGAFALFVGLRMLESGWPQSFVVALLQEARKKLEVAHRKLLKDGLMQPMAAEPKAGDLALPDGAFVVVHFTEGSKVMKSGSVTVYLTSDLQDVMRSLMRTAGQSTTIVPLGNFAQQLSDFLAQTQPRRRGRS